jgi:hypothetical protein
MRNTHSIVIALLLSSTVGCSNCKQEGSLGAAPATSGSASAAMSTVAQNAVSPKPSASSLKGSAEGGGGVGGGDGVGSGTVVIKTHQLPVATKPVSDFKPATSGFKFQNYGNEGGVTNLTAVELRRMFGDQVCASIEGDTCTLTPVAAQWLEGSNKSMGGGHCEGFAALSLLMERGQIDPKLFGAATVPELELKGNEKLQREIAYWFVTQGVPPMAMAEDKTLTPVQVVEKLEASLKGGVEAETYTLGIYAPGYKMGHATTPYAVVDKGNDVVWIMHYDNNYPNEEKSIVVDKKANTWSYTTAADPAAGEHAYKGDAETKTLTIAPTSVRTGPLLCHFCGSVDGGGADKGAKGSAAAVEMREISLEGNADLLITDEAGKRLGYADGKFVNEIAGAAFAADKSGDEAAEDEPSYYVPTGKALKVTLDGSALKKVSESELHLFGRGYSLGVEGVSLDPGQKDEIDFSADGKLISYTTKSAETPTLVVAIDTATADYEFEVQVSGETGGQTVELAIDLAKGTFGVKVKGGAGAKPTLSVKLSRWGEKGAAQVFHHKGVAIGADQSVSFGYAAWKGDKNPLHVAVADAKGAVVSEVEEADED